MKRKTYIITIDPDIGGKYLLSFKWRFEDGCWGERVVRLNNPNALVFMTDMLDKLGYDYVR